VKIALQPVPLRTPLFLDLLYLLSPLLSHSYKLFVAAKSVNSLVFSQFHTLVAKTPGAGYPLKLQASRFKPPD